MSSSTVPLSTIILPVIPGIKEVIDTSSYSTQHNEMEFW